MLFDVPPTIGHNLQRAIDQIASDNGVSNKVTHIVYSHHHADHLGASSLFGKDVVRIGQIQTRELLRQRARPHPPGRCPTSPTRPATSCGWAGERVNLAWRGTKMTPPTTPTSDFPDHDTLMLVDINLPRWVPFDSFNLNEDVQGSIAAPDVAMAYPWTHFIGGHMRRIGTR